MMQEIIGALEFADNDPDCRTVILTGTGEYFCNGGDLGDYRLKTSMEVRKFGKCLEQLHTTIVNLSNPVIASVQGHAAGGGMSLIEACDLAVASESATFGIPETRSGLAPMVALVGACGLLGRKGVMEMALLGECIPADTAMKIGLVNQICTKEKVMDTALEIAGRLSKNNPSAVALCKRLYQGIDSVSYEKKLRYAVEMLVSLLKSGDAEEALTSADENREPIWKFK